MCQQRGRAKPRGLLRPLLFPAVALTTLSPLSISARTKPQIVSAPSQKAASSAAAISSRVMSLLSMIKSGFMSMRGRSMDTPRDGAGELINFWTCTTKPGGFPKVMTCRTRHPARIIILTPDKMSRSLLMRLRQDCLHWARQLADFRGVMERKWRRRLFEIFR